MSFASDYTFIDRLQHYVAFSSPLVQKVLCDLENDLFKRHIEDVISKQEVFVTGLPRSGTTLLLELLYETGEFKTYTYRHMPFILAPLLWRKVSQRFQKAGVKKERAHGDRMLVSYDSPEAFEEIIWLTYMKQKIVNAKTLSPLSSGNYTEEFAQNFRNSVKKLLILDGEKPHSAKPLRYLSKNNANISRIEVITELFPSCVILVPFRHPLAQVSSLMKQHDRFSEQHGKDSFSKRYMKWIGHYDFGENFKPINYNGWLDKRPFSSQIDKNFWLEYWTEAYSYVLRHLGENLYLVDFDELLRKGKLTLEKIANCVKLSQGERLIDAAKFLRSPTTSPIGSNDCSSKKWNLAHDVYEQLKTHAL